MTSIAPSSPPDPSRQAPGLEAAGDRRPAGQRGQPGGAVPYHREADRLTGTIALSRRGIDWDALDGEPVDLVYLMVFPYLPGAPRAASMGTIVRHIKDGRFADWLRRSQTREQVIAQLGEGDDASL